MASYVFRRPIPVTVPAVTLPGQPFSTPVRRKALAVALVAASGVFAPPWVPTPVPAPTVDRYLQPWGQPLKLQLTKKNGLHAARAPAVFNVLGFVTGEVIYEDKWHQGWSTPVRHKRNPRANTALAASGNVWAPLPDNFYPGVNFAYFNRLSEPVRLKRDPRAARALEASGLRWTPQPSTFYPGETVEAAWHYGWSEPKRFKPGLHASRHPYEFNPASFTPPQVSFAYYNWLSDPKRFKRDPKAASALIASGLFWTAQPSTFYPGDTNMAPWHYAWSEPKRFKPRLHAARNPYEFNPLREPLVSFAYYNWLSEPKRFKKGLPVYQQRALFEDTANTTLPGKQPTWFTPFSEPKRFKRGIPTYQQDYSVLDIVPPPAPSDIIGWWMALTEPVRLPIGLKAWLQMTTAWEPRLLPTPDITATMAVTETNSDQAEIVYIVAGVAASAKVSIVEGPRAASALSIRES